LGPEAGHGGDAAAVAIQVADLTNAVFSSLDETAMAFRELFANAVEQGRQLTTADLAVLKPLLLRHLGRHRDLVMGTGVVIAPSLLADAPRWLEWWRSGPGETPTALHLDLDPGSLDYYDYTSAEWYVVPSRGAARAVVGPFVDFAGTNEYTLALTVRVAEHGSFLGVAGADLSAVQLEARVRQLMRGLDREVVLVNEDGRILASRSPRRVIGMLVGDAEAATRYPCPGVPWSMIALP
jgi:hypothetical protein